MKKLIWNLTFKLLFAGIVLMSCDSSDNEIVDTLAPSVEVEEPVMGEYFVAGDHAHFEATFTDDIELATFNIEIHDFFDGHSHGRKAATVDDPSLIKWSFDESFPIPEGSVTYEVAFEDEIEIPSNTMAGPYHFIVQAIDKAGNSTSYDDDSTVELGVYIANDLQPVVTITNLDGDELDIEVDVKFMVEGEVTDPTSGEYAGMHSLEVVLGEGAHDEHDHGGRIAEEDLIDTHFEEEELEQFMVEDAIVLNKIFETIDFTLSQIQLDQFKEEGVEHLLLTISVHDEQGNITVSNTEVHIHMD